MKQELNPARKVLALLLTVFLVFTGAIIDGAKASALESSSQITIKAKNKIDSTIAEAYWVLFLLVFERIRDMSKRYSQDFKDRAVRLLCDRLAADGSCSQWRAVNEIAPKLGVANESLRRWYEQHLVNTGERQGMTREEHEEVKRLKREVAELRRANEILKTASAFFAAELDRPAR